MAKKSQEIRDGHSRRTQVAKEVRDLEKEIDSKKKFQSLIKLSKEFTTITKFLQSKGENVADGPKRYDPKHWEDKLNDFNEKQKIISETKEIAKLPKKKEIIKSFNDKDKLNLYYIMLAWTVKPNYYVCNSIIDKVKNYLEKMKLTYIFTYMDEFPDRIEYSHEFKIKCTEDVYNTIISSAEYILEISTDSAYESCNIGVFGRKIE